MWPHHHPLYSKIDVALTSEQDRLSLSPDSRAVWLEGGSKETSQTKCVCKHLCVFLSLDESECLLEMNMIGVWERSDQFGMKQPVTSLPPATSSSSSFTFSGATRQGEAGMQERGETTTENVLLPPAIWQGWITN